MIFSRRISRRTFVQSTSLATAGAVTARLRFPVAVETSPRPLKEFGYGDVTMTSELHEKQLHETHAVLMELSEDSLLKPFRQMAGQPAPGTDLGGWYHYDPDYDSHAGNVGFAPAATFGQWVSALARTYAITGDSATREKVLRLNRLYAKTISGDFYEKNRFPAYCYDKLVCGLIDSHQLVHDPEAFSILEQTTNTALPHLPGKAIEHGQRWRQNPAEGYTWDESYTISENLFLAYQRGAGDRYRALGSQYLDDEHYYDPLAEGHNVLAGRHAYSYVNSLCSAMQAYLTVGSAKHLRAASNGFEMLKAQSFATGGWGPDEQLRAPGCGDVAASLNKTHNSFETPCGSYAHFKLTRYLLRVTRDSRYGDNMERVMYNTVLGAKPLLADGSTFYYSDYNFQGRKFYKEADARWPCCSGTLPQVAADYRINTYFCDSDGLYVNLYIPSTVRWSYESAQISLTQKSEYPFDGAVKFELESSKPAEFAIHLRIPKWAEGASISVNGKRESAPVAASQFATLRRTWKKGDRIELDLPMKLRLESIDPQHPQTVASLCGPLVLFAITATAPSITTQQLLAARKTGQQSWQVETAAGPMSMFPFTAIADQQYSTYVVATS
jgi:uncharacterized protein